MSFRQYRSDCCRQEDSLDSGLSSASSALYRPPVPWSGNPADRGKVSHVRRPDHQFQTCGSVPPRFTVPHPGYFSDSETEHAPADGRMFCWGSQRPCRHQAPPAMCPAGEHERRIQEWTERNIAGAGRPAPADYYTLGARRRQQVYNGGLPAMNTGVTADNPITNRYAT